MSARPGSRPVFSTAQGRLCPRCGWPVADCRCSVRFDEVVPARIVAKLRIEKAGRGGKTVTVVDGLPRNAAFLAALAAECRRACGTGGAAQAATVELQGDHRERLRALLAAKGWEVRG
jgi:translation initiation factor 1